MWFKYPVLILLFLFLMLLQASFMPYFNIGGTIPNLIFILFFVLVFFQKSNGYYEGIFLAIFAGFIFDASSSFYFGASIISFLLTYVFIKTIVYFLRERQDKYLLFYFVPIFLISLAFYNMLFYLLVNFFDIKMNFHQNILIGFIYSLFFACCAFFIYPHKKSKQLRLFK